MKYRLLRNCPHGKAGSVWEDISSDVANRVLKQETFLTLIPFPHGNFLDWFEPIVEMKKFSREQAIQIKSKAAGLDDTGWNRLNCWLDENTEK